MKESKQVLIQTGFKQQQQGKIPTARNKTFHQLEYLIFQVFLLFFFFFNKGALFAINTTQLHVLGVKVVQIAVTLHLLYNNNAFLLWR